MSASDHPEAALLAELGGVYERAEALYAGWSCDASTECCRFGVTGREPYVTSIELAALRRAIAQRGGPGSFRPLPRADGGRGAIERRKGGKAAPGKGARPEAKPRRGLPMARPDRVCPMLTDEGRCAVYAARPLGCRTFFCSRALEGSRVPHAAVRDLVRTVQQIAARHEPGGDLGRPLTNAL